MQVQDLLINSYLLTQSCQWVAVAYLAEDYLSCCFAVSLFLWQIIKTLLERTPKDFKLRNQLQLFSSVGSFTLYMALASVDQINPIPLNSMLNGVIFCYSLNTKLKDVTRQDALITTSCCTASIVFVGALRGDQYRSSQSVSQSVIVILYSSLTIYIKMRKGYDSKDALEDLDNKKVHTIQTEPQQFLPMSSNNFKDQYIRVQGIPSPGSQIRAYDTPIPEFNQDESQRSFGVSQLRSYPASATHKQLTQGLNDMKDDSDFGKVRRRTLSKMFEIPLISSKAESQHLLERLDNCMISVDTLLSMIQQPTVVMNAQQEVIYTNKKALRLFSASTVEEISAKVRLLFTRPLIRSSVDPQGVCPPNAVSQQALNQHIQSFRDSDLLDLLLNPGRQPQQQQHQFHYSNSTENYMISFCKEYYSTLKSKSYVLEVSVLQGGFFNRGDTVELNATRSAGSKDANNLVVLIKKKKESNTNTNIKLFLEYLDTCRIMTSQQLYFLQLAQSHDSKDIMFAALTRNAYKNQLSTLYLTQGMGELTETSKKLAIGAFNIKDLCEDLRKLFTTVLIDNRVKCEIDCEPKGGLESDYELLKCVMMLLFFMVAGNAKQLSTVKVFVRRDRPPRMFLFGISYHESSPPDVNVHSAKQFDLRLCNLLAQRLMMNKPAVPIEVRKLPEGVEMAFLVENLVTHSQIELSINDSVILPMEESIQTIHLSRAPFLNRSVSSQCRCPRLLVVESDEFTAAIIQYQFSYLGTKLEVVTMIEEAITIIRQCTQKECALCKILVNIRFYAMINNLISSCRQNSNRNFKVTISTFSYESNSSLNIQQTLMNRCSLDTKVELIEHCQHVKLPFNQTTIFDTSSPKQRIVNQIVNRQEDEDRINEAEFSLGLSQIQRQETFQGSGLSGVGIGTSSDLRKTNKHVTFSPPLRPQRTNFQEVMQQKTYENDQPSILLSQIQENQSNYNNLASQQLGDIHYAHSFIKNDELSPDIAPQLVLLSRLKGLNNQILQLLQNVDPQKIEDSSNRQLLRGCLSLAWRQHYIHQDSMNQLEKGISQFVLQTTKFVWKEILTDLEQLYLGALQFKEIGFEISFTPEVIKDFYVYQDKHQLLQLFRILLDQMIQITQPRGTIHLGIKGTETNGLYQVVLLHQNQLVSQYNTWDESLLLGAEDNIRNKYFQQMTRDGQNKLKIDKGKSGVEVSFMYQSREVSTASKENSIQVNETQVFKGIDPDSKQTIDGNDLYQIQLGNGCQCSPVLIVDDEPFNQLILCQIMSSFSIKVSKVFDCSRETIQRCESTRCLMRIIFVNFKVTRNSQPNTHEKISQLFSNHWGQSSLSPTLVLYSDEDPDLQSQSAQYEILQKPILRSNVERILKKYKLI